MWTIFKVNWFFFFFFYNTASYILFFGWEAFRILAPWLGIKPTAPALEGKILTTGALGKSPFWPFLRPPVQCIDI